MEQRNSKARLLLVDDDPMVVQLLSQKLSREGYVCHTALSGAEALKQLEQERIDLVITDLNMPGMSGLKLMEAAREKYPRTGFILGTGTDDVRVGVQAMKEGAEDYLVKPFQLDAVVANVARALKKKHREQEVENYRKHLEEIVDQRTRQLQAAMKRIELTYDETLGALGGALDLRDNETAGHSQRVSRYCVHLAKTLGCIDEQMRHIARGAYLHDIGKIGIPDSILLKPGKLTQEEKQIMEAHVRIGYDLVCQIAFLAPAAEIVLTHQERWDGTGYPQGLMGEEIPLGARVFAVADTLDAMTSDRPYRRALPYAAARAEMEREAGRQFDPHVVKTFLTVPEGVWEKIRLEVASGRFDAKKTPRPLGGVYRPVAS